MIDVRIALLLIGIGVVLALFVSSFAGGVVAVVGLALLVLDLLGHGTRRSL